MALRCGCGATKMGCLHFTVGRAGPFTKGPALPPSRCDCRLRPADYRLCPAGRPKLNLDSHHTPPAPLAADSVPTTRACSPWRAGGTVCGCKHPLLCALYLYGIHIASSPVCTSAHPSLSPIGAPTARQQHQPAASGMVGHLIQRGRLGVPLAASPRRGKPTSPKSARQVGHIGQRRCPLEPSACLSGSPHSPPREGRRELVRACSTQLQLQAVGPALGPVSLIVLFPWGPPIGPLLVPGLPAPLLRALSTFVMFACVVLLGSHPKA